MGVYQYQIDVSGKIALVKEMQQMDDEDDKMSVTTTASSDFEDDSSITQVLLQFLVQQNIKEYCYYCTLDQFVRSNPSTVIKL